MSKVSAKSLLVKIKIVNTYVIRKKEKLKKKKKKEASRCLRILFINKYVRLTNYKYNS